jgi:PAS domain S-box-containing protein
MTEAMRPDDPIGPDLTSVFLESLPGLFFVYDPDGRLIRWNRNHSLLTGYTADELEGMHFLDYFREDLHDDVRAAVKDMLERGFSMAEFALRKKDGSEVPFLFTARRIDMNGRPGFCGHGIDISKRKDLEHRLRHAEKMEAIGKVAGGIAHDFNNVLTAVLGNAEFGLAEPGLPEGTRVALEEIQRAADKARDLVSQILTFSRRDVKEVADLVLQEQIKEVEFLLRASTPRTARLEVELPERPVVIRANASQIHQILLNLCTNAGHALGRDEGLIRVALSRAEIQEPRESGGAEAIEPGFYAVLEVRDDGPGIPAAQLPRIFEPYFTTKPSGEGTGMGLTLVRNIARENGGFVEVESQEGRGTAFRVHLPERRPGPSAPLP